MKTIIHAWFSNDFRRRMSSRLFKEIRKTGVGLYGLQFFQLSSRGLFGIYAGTTNKELKELMPVICEEINKICREKVSEQELNRAKTQLKASMLMALESSSSTAEVLARQMLLFDRIIPIEEMVERIEKVSVDDVQNIARKIFSSNPTYTLVGDIEGYPPYDEIKQND
ncbi:MAG: M16 family metallopeptidase [Alphaproteobacteria bacterium]